MKMETARKALESMKKGTATILWGRIVMRVGDRYLVGETINIHAAGVSIDEAAAVLAARG
jgi:hypothetical protein